MASENEEFLVRAVGGDQEALSTLLEGYGPQVGALMAGRISAHWQSMVSADDVMQITYLEAFLKIEQFTPKGLESFVSWLTRIADNNLRDAIKALEAEKRPDPRRQLETPQTGDSFMILYDVLGGTSATPSRAAAGAEAEGIIEEVMKTLPEDYRRVVQLYDLDGRDSREVAELMNRSVGAVHMLRSRAHELLRRSLPPASRFFSKP